MLKITKQDIWSLPIAHWHTLNLVELEQEIQAFPLHHFASWLLPQLVAWFGSWSIKENGKDTVILNCDTQLKRVLYLLSRVPRSLLLQKQISTPEYARFTPLIALGLKRMQNINYEFWRGYEGREWILERDLLEAVDVAVPDLGSDRLLEIRDSGLLTRSGAKAGQHKNPETTWSLSGIQGTELGTLPKLTQTMLTQCWLAHPKNRRSEMILDPLDWDTIPSALVTADIFEAAPPLPKIEPPKQLDPRKDLPWD